MTETQRRLLIFSGYKPPEHEDTQAAVASRVGFMGDDEANYRHCWSDPNGELIWTDLPTFETLDEAMLDLMEGK